MSNVKLPKAGWLGDIHGYSAAQLKQYGDDRAREALEMAAKVCETGWGLPSGIRALAKEIK